MKDGPVSNVPTTVTDMGNNVVSIYLDPTAVSNHFGDTPIYGTITKSVPNNKVGDLTGADPLTEHKKASFFSYLLCGH